MEAIVFITINLMPIPLASQLLGGQVGKWVFCSCLLKPWLWSRKTIPNSHINTSHNVNGLLTNYNELEMGTGA